jgi:predicted CoA-binding protein
MFEQAPAHYVPDDDKLRDIIANNRTIAVVGLSSRISRPSFGVAQYMQAYGYRIIPVNPTESEVLGERAYPSLLEVGEPIDMVDVFRRPELTPEVAREAVAAGAKALWLQLDIVSDEARRIAEEGGLDVVMGVCLKVEHRRLGIGAVGQGDERPEVS